MELVTQVPGRRDCKNRIYVGAGHRCGVQENEQAQVWDTGGRVRHMGSKERGQACEQECGGVKGLWK